MLVVFAVPEPSGVTVLDMGMGQAVLLLAASVVVPVLGNLLPGRISFLPSMRYYAGNWAMSVWFFAVMPTGWHGFPGRPLGRRPVGALR